MSHSITSLLCVASLAILYNIGTVSAVSVRFIPVDDEVAAFKIAVKDVKKTTPLYDLNPLKRSTIYQCVIGDAPLQLVALDRKSPDGNPAFIAIPLKPNNNSHLVLILSDSQHPSGLHAIASEDTIAAFPWGSIRLFNTTGNPLIIRFGDDLKSLPKGENPIDIRPDGPARKIGVQILLEKEPEEIVYSAVWEHDPKVRKLILVLPGTKPNSNAVELKIIPEDQRIKG